MNNGLTTKHQTSNSQTEQFNLFKIIKQSQPTNGSKIMKPRTSDQLPNSMKKSNYFAVVNRIGKSRYPIYHHLFLNKTTKT